MGCAVRAAWNFPLPTSMRMSMATLPDFWESSSAWSAPSASRPTKVCDLRDGLRSPARRSADEKTFSFGTELSARINAGEMVSGVGPLRRRTASFWPR